MSFISLKRVMEAIEEEPELTDSMPDEMFEVIRDAVVLGDKDVLAECLRIIVRQTKLGISNRIKSL